MGRLAVMTPEVISKLEEVFSLGGTDAEACFFAGISPSSLYSYQLENPDFLERKDALKETPVLKARRTVVNSLDNPQQANWFLERKAKKEFSTRHELTGEGGEAIKLTFDPSFDASPRETKADC